MVAALFRAAWPDAKLGFAFFASKIVAAMHILMCEHAHEILAKEIILLMQQKKIQCTRKLENELSSNTCVKDAMIELCDRAFFIQSKRI